MARTRASKRHLLSKGHRGGDKSRYEKNSIERGTYILKSRERERSQIIERI
jgi:hypothetical protein